MRFLSIIVLFISTSCLGQGIKSEIIEKDGFLYQFVFKEQGDWFTVFTYSDELKCNFQHKNQGGIVRFDDENQIVLIWHSLPLDREIDFKDYNYDFNRIVKNAPNRCYKLESELEDMSVYMGNVKVELLPFDKLDNFSELRINDFVDEDKFFRRFRESTKFYLIVNFNEN